MARIDAIATYDGLGNVTLQGYTATHDGAGNVAITPVGASATETEINARVRTIKARVELLDGSTLLDVFCHDDRLQGFSVERTGESKFFGFGICQKLKLDLLDPDRTLTVTTANRLDVSFGVGGDYTYPLPPFRVTEVNRDENTNALSITAYDALEEANGRTVAELPLPTSYSIRVFATACATLLGLPIVMDRAAASAFDAVYPEGANFDGTETIREALNAVAEATQTVYYVGGDWALTFKRLAMGGTPKLTIDREKYFTLDSKTNRRLSAVCSATELGDNVSASLDVSGTTQYVRDNPFWDTREDVGKLVDAALAAVGGLTINQFECEWRGNYLLELCDPIALETKDGGTASTYLLDDTITYDGTLSQRSGWSYTDTDESESNPTNLGEVLKKTFARVDKANQQITLVASKAEANAESIASLQINTDSISASVQSLQENTQAAQEAVSGELATLSSKVSAAMTAEQVQLQIQQELTGGVSKVQTETGYTFDADGLKVTKSDSEMETTITEDGMSVTRSGEEVLRADNEGVKAEDLHATTYLIIGENSRFEDYEKDGEARTGCFWIGPTDNE
jgi:hypothetical protein